MCVRAARSRSRHRPSPVAGFAEHRGVASDGSIDAQAETASCHRPRAPTYRRVPTAGARPISAVAARPTSQPAMLAVSPRPSCGRCGSLLASSSCRFFAECRRPAIASPPRRGVKPVGAESARRPCASAPAQPPAATLQRVRRPSDPAGRGNRPVVEAADVNLRRRLGAGAPGPRQPRSRLLRSGSDLTAHCLLRCTPAVNACVSL